MSLIGFPRQPCDVDGDPPRLITAAAPTIRPDVGTDHPAFRADHARSELPHQEITRVLVDVEDHLVPAALAHDVERTHAVLAHVRQVHGFELVFEEPAVHRSPIGFPRPDHRRAVGVLHLEPIPRAARPIGRGHPETSAGSTAHCWNKPGDHASLHVGGERK
jgi:hypothetical protein